MKSHLILLVLVLCKSALAQTIYDPNTTTIYSQNGVYPVAVNPSEPATGALLNGLANVAFYAAAATAYFGGSEADQALAGAIAVNYTLTSNYNAYETPGELAGLEYTYANGYIANAGLNVTNNTGVCADFSTLASIALTQAGIPNSLVGLTSPENPDASHAAVQLTGADGAPVLVNMNWNQDVVQTFSGEATLLGGNTLTVIPYTSVQIQTLPGVPTGIAYPAGLFVNSPPLIPVYTPDSQTVANAINQNIVNGNGEGPDDLNITNCSDNLGINTASFCDGPQSVTCMSSACDSNVSCASEGETYSCISSEYEDSNGGGGGGGYPEDGIYEAFED